MVYTATAASLANPATTDKLNNPLHSDQHVYANDAIENQGVWLENVDDWRNVVHIPIINAAGSAATYWIRAPWACNLSGYVIYGVSSGTGRTVSVAHGSAGDNALATETAGVSGTVGVAVLFVASASASATAGETLRIVTTTCATAQNYGVMLVMAKTDTT
jgi:hypothetical protein